ncbi:hypothetical protein Cni_G02485 [Canna indica]|uniref:Uncharacterized protein n=1 Tax=Canna indica TaxID=4628 RepID=A0AAQ3JPB1_9LILI|nr:hypothetical protein Cni_G02485 [Canna indica]
MASSTALWTILFLSLLSLQAYGHGGSSGGQDDQTTTDGSPPADLRAKGLIDVKIWCLVILLVSTFAGGVSPYFFRWNESFLVMGIQFAGGVFLGTALMHFLSDANSTFMDRTSIEYPFAFMLASAGYLLTMLGDCIIVTMMQRAKKEAKVEAEGGRGGDEGHHHQQQHSIDPALVAKTSSLGDTVLLILALYTKGSAWRNLWTISLHKIFAAISMGIALLRMLPDRPLLTTVAYSLAFAISSPVGVGIGIAIDATTQGATADWIFAISMGIACGVFVYVAINHLIAKGFKPSQPNYFDTPFLKFLAVLAGVGVIAVVITWD